MENKEDDQKDSVIRDKTDSFFFLLEHRDRSYVHLGDLFNLFLYVISRFGEEEGELDDVDLPFKNWEMLSKSYSGDSTLFEVGCFLYFLIDQWLRENRPKLLKSAFFDSLLTKFVQQFIKIFGHDNLRDYYKQRYSKYLEIAEEGGNIEDYFFYVKQLIYLTKDNSQPKEYDFEIMTIVPFTHLFWIRAQFFTWYECMVPQAYKTIETFVTQHDETEELPS